MDQMTPTSQPMPAGGAPDPEDDTSGGYTIEIKVDGSGGISVCVEPAAEEASEESAAGGAGGAEGGGMADDDYQPVGSIREACKLVMQIYASQGQLPDTGQDQADMSAGYGKD